MLGPAPRTNRKANWWSEQSPTEHTLIMSAQQQPETATNNGGGIDMGAMKKMLMDTKVDGKKSVWATTLETFGMADGSTQKTDIVVDSVEQGLELLQAYVTEQEASNSKPLCWDLVPLEPFRATRDDFLLAFLKWAEKEDEQKMAQVVNVSKARRRLDAYFQWMSDNRKDLEEPLTVDSVSEAAKLWDIQVTYDEKDRFLWWIDLGSLDTEGVKKLGSQQHLRYVVFFAHLVMLDKKARENGAVIIEDLGGMGFWKMATLVPTDLSAKMDRLTIGILPVKMKAIYVFGAATWMSLLMAMMKPFMGKKMRERMILVPKATDMQTFCDDLGLSCQHSQGILRH